MVFVKKGPYHYTVYQYDIPHDILINKMKNFSNGVENMSILHSRLTNRKQCVKIENPLREVISGVPQGSIL